jgi:8-oxo-dGTP pyrophosphatase MutT (NUDIX family)
VYWFLFRPITLGVRVILVSDGKVLLVRHTYRAGWFLPGGGVKRGETLDEAARREAREEVGATLNSLHFHGIYANFFEMKSDHIAVFSCSDYSLSGAASGEIDRIAAFALDSLPTEVSTGTRRRLAEYARGTGWVQTGKW